MTPGARATSRRIVPAAFAAVIAALLCAFALAPSAHAGVAGSGSGSHLVATVHQQGHLAHRGELPDLIQTAPASPALVATPVPAAAAAETDSNCTVHSTRTRGPPATG